MGSATDGEFTVHEGADTETALATGPLGRGGGEAYNIGGSPEREDALQSNEHGFPSHKYLRQNHMGITLPPVTNTKRLIIHLCAQWRGQSRQEFTCRTCVYST